MNSAIDFNNTRRRPANISSGARLKTKVQKSAAQEVLRKLRSALASLESEFGNDDFGGSQLQKQVRDCETLHQEAMKAVRDSVPCESKAFKRRMTAQSALAGLHFS